MKNQSIMARLAALNTTSTADLRTMWKELFSANAPSFNRQYLESRLAYRIQELAYGGLSRETQKRLRALVENPGQNMARKSVSLSTGTMIKREWRGVVYSVTVLADGFEYQGKRYRSLSLIARDITGVNRSGPKFFGLRSKAGCR